jgi:hypothetical protein
MYRLPSGHPFFHAISEFGDNPPATAGLHLESIAWTVQPKLAGEILADGFGSVWSASPSKAHTPQKYPAVRIQQPRLSFGKLQPFLRQFDQRLANLNK